MTHRASVVLPSPPLDSPFYLVSGKPCCFDFNAVKNALYLQMFEPFTVSQLLHIWLLLLFTAGTFTGVLLFFSEKKKQENLFFFLRDDDTQEEEERSHCSASDNNIAGICRSDAIQFTADCNRIAERRVAHELQSKSSCGHTCLKPGRARWCDPGLNRR